ncbi:putative invertase inhibitor [Triticum dicoccoides]|uniref:putative invertase inhibitor n=1 Tax=Triticum dicoccoides TaxID=85692 RepID=UPI0018912746|nr:putative invertase inhibitor [Triticum dicoccoides]
MASFSSSSTSVITVLLLLLPVLLAPPASAVPVLAACKTVGGGSTYFDVTFCLEALGSVGGGGLYRDLAAAAVGLLAANATSTEAKIGRLLGESGVKIKAGDAALARPLRSCLSLYGGIVHGGPACTAAVKGGKFGDATAILEKAAAAAKECEDGFRRSNAASPLTAEDDDAFKLAKLGVALLGFA